MVWVCGCKTQILSHFRVVEQCEGTCGTQVRNYGTHAGGTKRSVAEWSDLIFSLISNFWLDNIISNLVEVYYVEKNKCKKLIYFYYFYFFVIFRPNMWNTQFILIFFNVDAQDEKKIVLEGFSDKKKQRNKAAIQTRKRIKMF